MGSIDKHHPSATMDRMTGVALPGLLALALLVTLFPLPGPLNHVNHPFKVEFLLSLFLMAYLMTRAGKEALFSQNGALVRSISYCLAAFTAWSAVSVIWGDFPGSVTHHTLLWAIYLIFFLIFTNGTQRSDSRRFITSTFFLVALILGVLCIFDYLTVVDFVSSEGELRIRYGKYAELLVTITPLLLGAAVYIRNRKWMLSTAAVALLGWVTVMLSLSKGAFLAGIIGFVIFFLGAFLFSVKRFRKRVAIVAAAWLLLTIGTQVFFSYFSAVPSTTNYITGAADATRSTSTMRVFTWKVARQMAADHWLTGVGADNFGHAFNRERIRFRETHPNDTTVEIAEDYLVERAHNEPIQILSELGVIGSLLIFLPFMLFLTWLAKSFVRTRRFSPVMWAALSGMAAFLVSSMFSSFSFRAAQNGVAFFMVFAVAVTNLPRAGVQTKRRNFGSGFSRPVHLFGWVITILMAVFCLTKIFAEYQVYKAERAEFYQEAVDHLQLAVAADPEYAGAYMSNSGIAAKEGDHGSAAKSMRKAIDNGIATTPVYSQLAKQQVAAGNFEQAEATYREALAIYPRSIFLRMEFAVFLEDHGKPDAAAEQAKIARSIDLRQANGWYSIIREDSITAFYRSQKEPDLAPPAELLPPTAVLQYVGKMPGS